MITLEAPASRIPSATVAGAMTAASVLGMLLGLGSRHSTLWRPLNAAAHTVLGSRADGVWGFQADVTIVGIVVVLLVSAAAALGVAALASSRRALPEGMVAVAVALAGYLAHAYIVARRPGGLAELLTVGEMRALYTGAAVALFAGMRYAFWSIAGHR